MLTITYLSIYASARKRAYLNPPDKYTIICLLAVDITVLIFINLNQ